MKKNTPSNSEEKTLKGIGVSPGIVIGKAAPLERSRATFVPRKVTAGQVISEVKRFEAAIEESKKQLEEVKQRILEKGFGQHSYILDVHLKLMEDRMLRDETIRMIQEQLVNTEWALKVTLDKISDAFDAIEDEYLKERKEDIRHVVERVLRNLIGRELRQIEDLEGEVIVVAHDLSPADTIQLNLQRVIGFVTEVGGKTSHTAIVSRSLEIPAVVGLEDITTYVAGGETIIIDGTEGIIVVDPSPATIKAYQLKQQRYRYLERELLKYAPLTSETQDGYYLTLQANIELIEEIPAVIQYGAAGIGLYRTEFLYLNRKTLPDEEEHVQVYKQLVQKIAPYPVTIRTLDLGGDKFASHIELAEEMNPAMGLRAIRFCLMEQDIFKAQLRGILRASTYGKVKILLPMISGVEELRQVKVILEDAKDELRAKKVAFDPDIPLGVMIEIPSAAITADILACEADFFSIGTNDLIQYSLAIDRVNEHVSYLYEPLHPAILRNIKGVVDIAHKEGIEVGICGEMAADPLYTLIFLGLGLDELSMHPLAIPRVKKVLRRSTHTEGEGLLKEVLQFSTAKETELFIRKKMAERFPEDFIQCKE
ncbi:MAG: phosphoenolpyruvate--protein phosphotransferase [Deltaproteobacteria bacterium RBG_16_54_11]|nr:MAG: phosphoenolpyruvate--protein phosphotransferase [Deltaproteobacteria bacterium RBG_16_54_11]